ncbi:MAG: hypothetical protein OEZ68_16125 [Gammaproteobacteria bacterium]|nr:hypothetical protein [Gammaproteobacteria bacterium]MDH5802330.1 hypothetical protein [Gammaproteobacteria bacterium]
MNDENTESVKAAAEEAVKKGGNVRDEIRDITLEALSNRTLDMDRVKAVAKAVVDGAKTGLDVDTADVKKSMDDVAAGLDAALEKSAQATKLAIEETVARVKDYKEEDFKHTLDQLHSLEEMFIETLEEAAKTGKSLLQETIQDLATHAKNTGTAVGKRTSDDIAELKQKILNVSEAGVTAVSDAAKSFSADVAQAASGFLQALSDKLKSNDDQPKS